MSPSLVAKSGRRWRYYVSQAILQGRKHEAGSVARVSAMEVEGHVAEAVRAAFPCGRQRRCVSLTDQRTMSHAPSDRAATGQDLLHELQHDRLQSGRLGLFAIDADRDWTAEKPLDDLKGAL